VATLRKEIRSSQFFTLAFGAIIGVGWLVVLGEWLRQAGPLGAILALLGGGSVMMLVGLCYAEMATMLPVSGGEVAYAYELYGVKTCFATGWFLALAYISVTAFEAISVGWIASVLFPGIKGATLYASRGEPVQLGSLLLGLGGMVVLSWLNYRGARSAAIFQDLLTYGLIILSAAFISAGIVWGQAANLEPLFQRSEAGPAWRGVLSVLVTAPFWYAGFNVIPQVMEERAPKTSLRLAGRMILLAIGIAALFYSLVILACSMTMPWERLLALELPAAGAFEAAFDSPALAKVVLLAALLGLVTTWNTVFISASRVLFALGRARVISAALARVHSDFGSPTTAVLFVGGVASGGVFLGRSAIIPIVNLAGTCLAFAFFLTCLGVIRMRRKRPELPRPYRVPGGSATATLATVGALLMVCFSLYQPYLNGQGIFPLEWMLLLVWAVLGALFWALAHKVRRMVNESERRKLILGVENS
jgi:amino acid transporter